MELNVARIKGWWHREFPSVAVILGSGLGGVCERLDAHQSIAYHDLHGLPMPSVAGHGGHLHVGLLQAMPVMLFQGRYHLYEGYSVSDVTRLVQLAADLGVQHLLLTNAAGGIADRYRAGDFMWVTDHLNLTGHNPLIGQHPPSFLDLSHLYEPTAYEEMQRVDLTGDAVLHQGVLAGMVGPNYETPAEIQMLKTLGADAVSMSTVNEALWAHALGMKVSALSVIANSAAGVGDHAIDHADVLRAGKRATENFVRLLVAYLQSTISPPVPS